MPLDPDLTRRNSAMNRIRGERLKIMARLAELFL